MSLINVLPAHAGMIPNPRASAIRRDSAPRACGDDPRSRSYPLGKIDVLPAHAGMIPASGLSSTERPTCSPRMRG